MDYMSALFNVDLEKGDNIIVRIMTDERMGRITLLCSTMTGE